MCDFGGIYDVSTIIRMDILTTGARGVRLITTGARGFRLLKPISMSRYWSFHTQGTQTEDGVIPINHLGIAYRGNPTLKCKALLIPYSDNP